MKKVEEILLQNPVIAAIRNENEIEDTINSSAQVVFILRGNIMTIGHMCKLLNAAGKTVLVHIDMIDGLKGDASGLEFIKFFGDPAGILTTKPQILKHAKAFGFYTVLRVFIIDSMSFKTGIKNILEIGPDAVEVMPGVATKIIEKMKNEVSVPVIAGGLVRDKKDIMEALGAGALAISTTCNNLWNL